MCVYIYVCMYVCKVLDHSSLTFVNCDSVKFIFSLYLNSAFGNHRFYWIFGIESVADLICGVFNVLSELKL